jgi:excisionase family DNA binding protein
MLKVAEVAQRLRLSQSKVYELIDCQKLGHHRLDGAIRVTEAQLQSYLDDTRQEPARRNTPASRPRLKHLNL